MKKKSKKARRKESEAKLAAAYVARDGISQKDAKRLAKAVHNVLAG